MNNVSFFNWLLIGALVATVATIQSYAKTGSDVIPGTSCCGAGFSINGPGPDNYWEGVKDRKAGKALPKGASPEYLRGYNGQ